MSAGSTRNSAQLWDPRGNLGIAAMPGSRSNVSKCQPQRLDQHAAAVAPVRSGSPLVARSCGLAGPSGTPPSARKPAPAHRRSSPRRGGTGGTGGTSAARATLAGVFVAFVAYLPGHFQKIKGACRGSDRYMACCFYHFDSCDPPYAMGAGHAERCRQFARNKNPALWPGWCRACCWRWITPHGVSGSHRPRCAGGPGSRPTSASSPRAA